MTFLAVVDQDGRPMVQTRNAELRKQAIAKGGRLVSDPPPRRSGRKWRYDFTEQMWTVDMEKEQERTNRRARRASTMLEAQQAYQRNRELVIDDPVLQSMHENYMQILLGIANWLDD